MFSLIKPLWCDHEYEKHSYINHERDGFDRISTTITRYRCIHCEKTFKVIEKVKREDKYYFNMDRVSMCLALIRAENAKGKKKRRTITTKESLKNIKPLRTDKE